MACEPDEVCTGCDTGEEQLTCERLISIRCKLLNRLEKIICMPDGPVEFDGLRFESRSAAMKSVQESISWANQLCSQMEGPAIEYSSAEQCSSGLCRGVWWGTCHD